MKKHLFFLIAFLPYFFISSVVAQITAYQILEKVEQNYESENGTVSTITMIIKGKRATRTIKSKIWSKGEEQTFVHFLSPPREKDTKMLKLGDELWISSPTTDRIIKIAGHMLRQSIMGSDESYEDFMNDPSFKRTYNAEIIGKEILNDRLCYVLNIKAKEGKNVAYHARKVWIDKERYLILKEQLYAKGGKLLKKVTIEEVFKVKDRWYPKRAHTKDMLMVGDGTWIIIDSMDFNFDIPEYIFSKAHLRR